MVLGISPSAERPPGREHIPAYPSYFRILRRLQFSVSVAVLGLDAYGLSVLSFAGDELMMFTCVASVLVCAYYSIAHYAAPAAFNYWAALCLDILLVVFWLASFALLAAQVAPFMGSYYACNDFGYCQTYGLTGAARVYAGCLLAAAGLGALNFVLFTATLVIGGYALHIHRAQNLHSTPVKPATPSPNSAAAAAATPTTGSPSDASAAEKAAAAASVIPVPQPSHPSSVPMPYYEMAPGSTPAGAPPAFVLMAAPGAAGVPGYPPQVMYPPQQAFYPGQVPVPGMPPNMSPHMSQELPTGVIHSPQHMPATPVAFMAQPQHPGQPAVYPPPVDPSAAAYYAQQQQQHTPVQQMLPHEQPSQ